MYVCFRARAGERALPPAGTPPATPCLSTTTRVAILRIGKVVLGSVCGIQLRRRNKSSTRETWTELMTTVYSGLKQRHLYSVLVGGCVRARIGNKISPTVGMVAIYSKEEVSKWVGSRQSELGVLRFVEKRVTNTSILGVQSWAVVQLSSCCSYFSCTRTENAVQVVYRVAQ